MTGLESSLTRVIAATRQPVKWESHISVQIHYQSSSQAKPRFKPRQRLLRSAMVYKTTPRGSQSETRWQNLPVPILYGLPTLFSHALAVLNGGYRHHRVTNEAIYTVDRGDQHGTESKQPALKTLTSPTQHCLPEYHNSITQTRGQLCHWV